jgi:zinc protease
LQAVVTDRLRDDQRVLVTGGIKTAPPGVDRRAAPPATAARPAPRPAPAPFRLTRDDPRWQKPPAIAGAKTSTGGSRWARLRPTRLRNGLQVWLLPAPDADTVRMDLVIPAGSADDPPGLSGVARQLVRALAGPVSGAAGPLDALAQVGASIETAVDSDRTRLSLLVGRGQAERALPLWIGLLAGARIDEGAKAALSSPAPGAPQSERELARLMLGDQHPYVRSLEPSGAGVNAAALRAFFDRHYLPGRATLVATGPIAPAALARGLERWSGGSARGARTERPARNARRGRPERAPGKAMAAARVRPRIVLLDRPGATNSELRIGHTAVARDSKDLAAVLVANELLGGRFGRLDRLLRLERPLALGLRSVADARRAGGVWVIEARFAAVDTMTGLQEILKTLDALASGEASTQEVGRARVVLARRMAARAGPRLDRAAALADLAGAGLDERALAALPRALESVGADDVRRVCRTYLALDQLSMVVSGDKARLEELLREVGEVEIRPEAPAAAGPATAALR